MFKEREMFDINREEITKLIEEKELQVNNLYIEINELKNKLREIDSETVKLSLKEKINIFSDYFRGRDDVYPYLSIGSNGSKYYMPACTNEWDKHVCNKTMGKKCRDCKYREDKPLSLAVIEKHLCGDKKNSNNKNTSIGLYPLLEDDTCYLLVFDFDDKSSSNSIKEDVLAFLSVCDKYGINAVMEKSRSGKGIHVWIFFEDKIKAITARKLGSLLLSKTMEIRDTLSIKSFDRMFPNQDFLPKGGYGNLIALPFQNEPLKYGNTLFVDRNFIQIKNQFHYLSNVHKLTLDEVFDKIKMISNEVIDISSEEVNLKKEVRDKKKNNYKFPKTIDIIFDDMIYIDKANLNAGVKNSFRRLATFANPEFYKNQRLRLSTYNIPMIIDCSSEDEKYLKIPRGTYEYLCDLCNEHSVKINLEDKRNRGNKIEVSFNGELRSEQMDALVNMKKYDNGILCAPTAFGKTVISCKMIEEMSVNTLIVVPTLVLLKQWKDSVKKFLGVDAGQIGGGKNNVTGVIDIASMKSLWNNGKLSDAVKNYGMIIIDECHHISAFTYESAINKVNSKYVYGVSATPYRENGHTPILKMQCGDIRYEVDFKKFNKNLDIFMRVNVKKSHLLFVDESINNYELNEIKDFIVKDVIRNDKIIDDIVGEYKSGKNILVITERIEHLKYFCEKLLKVTENIFAYYGGIGKKEIKKYEEMKEKIKVKNENKILIATGAYIGEGFDDPSLDVLFITMPISAIGKVIQYTGRLHRKNEGKKEIIVYDYVDDNFSQTRNMYLRRKKTYEKLGYNVVEN